MARVRFYTKDEETLLDLGHADAVEEVPPCCNVAIDALVDAAFNEVLWPPSSLDGSVIGGRGRQTGRQSGRFRRGGGAAHSGSNHNLNMSHSLSINQSMNSSFDQDSIADLSR